MKTKEEIYSLIKSINKSLKEQKLAIPENKEPEIDFFKTLELNGYELKDAKLGVGNKFIESKNCIVSEATTCFLKNQYSDLYKECKNNNYRLIIHFPWESTYKLSQLLNSHNSIGARECTISLIPQQTARKFLESYHLQGDLKRDSYITYGLMYKDELIEIMCFGKPRYSKNEEWELLRLCTKSEYSVSGGANKLLSKFINEFNPESIVSYCDLSKFDGKVYEMLGFKLHKISPASVHWWNGENRISDNLLRSKGADILLKTNYGKGTDNVEIIKSLGYEKYVDAGQSTYIWSK